ncbi:MAG: hypothetical protein MAG795_00128 [Candidatus Woesearchaeota archaeon]|nr:hypothetical protein [Candidatus Woesearchaeota archaeon]
MKTILCFGNPHLKQDSLAITLAKKLKIEGFKFKICIRPEELLENTGKEILIMDVVKGINKVKLITDIDQFRLNKIITLHDMDLGFYLKLLKQTGQIEEVKVIGLPQKAEQTKAKQQIKELLRKTL